MYTFWALKEQKFHLCRLVYTNVRPSSKKKFNGDFFSVRVLFLHARCLSEWPLASFLYLQRRRQRPTHGFKNFIFKLLSVSKMHAGSLWLYIHYIFIHHIADGVEKNTFFMLLCRPHTCHVLVFFKFYSLIRIYNNIFFFYLAQHYNWLIYQCSYENMISM